MPWILLLLTVFGPISMDLYLPALPALTRELEATTSIAQLTVTACLIGLAAGQLLAGPASDQYGRRRILLIGVVAYVLTSLLCALSPSIELLILARFVQGLAGGVGIVIAQAAGRDVYDGRELIRFYSRLAIAGPTAAIVGPMIGGLLNVVIDWLFLLASGAQVASPAGTTLALSENPRMAGTAGSVLGTARFGLGAVAAPFVGIAGSMSILPLGVVTTGVALLALGAALLTLRRSPVTVAA